MSVLTNNNPREDAVFKTKVMGAVLCDSGTGGLVEVLLRFRQEHTAALQRGQAGLDYSAFADFLRRNGASELTEKEVDYLCHAFDDKQNGCISAETFLRHLTGLNRRRWRAVMQAWQALPKNASEQVAREALIDTIQTYASSAGDARVAPCRADESAMLLPGAATAMGMQRALPMQRPRCDTLASTFTTSTRASAKRALASCPPTTKTTTATQHVAQRNDDEAVRDSAEVWVSREEFLAYYAGFSQRVRRDEAFEVHLLRVWDADERTRPVLNSTQRDWSSTRGDPLAIDTTHYVKDALRTELGRSGKSYNYSHMQRVHPYLEPLPPLHRPTIMRSTFQQSYRPYDTLERNRADPLLTRRGQLM